MVAALFGSIVNLSKNLLELFGNRQAKMRGILQDGNSFIGKVEKDYCCAQGASCSQNMNINNIGDPHEHDNLHLLEDSAKANRARQLFIQHCAHDAGDVVCHHENQKRNHLSIDTSQEIPEPTTQHGKSHLNFCPHQINRKITHTASSSFLQNPSVGINVGSPDAVVHVALIVLVLVGHLITALVGILSSCRLNEICPRFFSLVLRFACRILQHRDAGLQITNGIPHALNFHLGIVVWFCRLSSQCVQFYSFGVRKLTFDMVSVNVVELSSQIKAALLNDSHKSRVQ